MKKSFSCAIFFKYINIALTKEISLLTPPYP